MKVVCKKFQYFLNFGIDPQLLLLFFGIGVGDLGLLYKCRVFSSLMRNEELLLQSKWKMITN